MSLMVGTFYRAASLIPIRSSKRATARKGQALCIIEAMKMMNEIEADAGADCAYPV
jgi:acetyl-CoA carboxylase biotin carboxyl carrier protein